MSVFGKERMEKVTSVNGKRVIAKVVESIFGKMGTNMKVSGLTH